MKGHGVVEHSITMLGLLVLAAVALCGRCSEGSLEDHGRVVGGYNAMRNSWPSQISLQYSSVGGWLHTCGGTLVRRNWVMTAAHCVADRKMDFRVVAGDHNIYQPDRTEQYLNVGRIFVHPFWNSAFVPGYHDIALLRLSQNAVLNKYVQFGSLPPAGEILPDNYPCYITGWGKTKTDGQLASVLQEASLPVVSYAACSTPEYWGSTVKDNMVCAGGDGTSAGCQGDSGGPLNCAVDGKYYVYGITSFVSSRGCNVYQKPTVFIRVSAYISWINKLKDCVFQSHNSVQGEN